MAKNGVTKIKTISGWNPLKGLWYKDYSGWQPVKTAWVKTATGWETIYPTPAGILSPTTAVSSLSTYQNYSVPYDFSFTNTGNYSLTLTSVYFTDSANTSTVVSGITIPVTLDIGASQSVGIDVTGLTVGTAVGNLNIVANTGYFTHNYSIPVTTTVLPDFNGISLSPSPLVFTGYPTDLPITQNFTITNIGNGQALGIAGVNVSGDSGLTVGPAASTVAAFGANVVTATFAGTDATDSYTANYTITVSGNSQTGTNTLPVQAIVTFPHGNTKFDTPGVYTWTVPAGVGTVRVAVIGGGGGGGGSTEVGDGGGGGGGGSGGYSIAYATVTPGEILNISVGAGGAGSPFVGRNPGSVGAEGSGSTGGSSEVTGTNIFLAGTGGSGGGPAYGGYPSQGGSAGGNGGGLFSGSAVSNALIGGNSGQPGTTGLYDNSSTYGGTGGTTGIYINSASTTMLDAFTINSTSSSTYGQGGRGADAPDRVSPYNWAGYNGYNGAVVIWW